MNCLVVFLFFTIIVASVNCDGSVPIQGKIVGGREVGIRQYPYQVSVRSYDSHICGGSIMSRTKILTAAHCTNGQDNTSMSIRHGSNIADDGFFHKVVAIYQHPRFNHADFNRNDVSVLQVEPPINYTSSSRPAKLAEERLADGSDVEICGWGVHYYGAPTAGVGMKKLRAVTVRVVNQKVCNQDYNTTRISDKSMCAAAKGKDSCQGDSGGALIDPKTRKIVGISSFGEGCAEKGKPGGYASVPDLLNFIRKHL